MLKRLLSIKILEMSNSRPYWAQNREKLSTMEHKYPKTEKVGYQHQVAMITIAPSKALPEPQKEDDGGGQTEEDETVGSQAPPEFEEGEQATKMNFKRSTLARVGATVDFHQREYVPQRKRNL